MKVNKADLQKALEKVKPGLANRETIEQTTSFAFTGDRVVTYNDEISISHPVEGMDVTGAVKAQALYDLLNKIKKDEIDVEWEDQQVIIRSGKAKAGLVLEQEIKLPLEEEIGEKGKWKKLPGNFREVMKFCYPCASPDMARPVLSCVHVAKDRAEASNSFQIVFHEMEKKMPVPAFLIPASAVRELVKYDVTQIAEGQSWIHFRTEDGTLFSARTLDNEFPDTSGLMEVTGIDFEFPKNTREILTRAGIFAKRDMSTGDVPTVAVEIKDKKVIVKAANEYGWFEEDAKTKYDGDPARFSVGVEFLIEMFGKLQKCVIGPDKIGFSGPGWKHVVAITAEGDQE